jgi:hypothetical protein
MDLRATVLDTFGFLVEWRGSLVDGRGAWGAERGPSADRAGLADAWRGEYQLSVSGVRTGKRLWQDWDVVAASVEDLAERLGC